MSCIAFDSPCSVIVSGPSGSGKSNFVFNLLENPDQMFTRKLNKIYYFYSVWQELFDICKLENLNFIKKFLLRVLEDITDGNHHLLIIDNLQISALNNGFIANLFTRESHHRNLSYLFYKIYFTRVNMLGTYHLMLIILYYSKIQEIKIKLKFWEIN